MYHRGLERRVIFREDADREHFVKLLEQVHERYRVRLVAYCLMSNHWHGVVQTPEANISEAMQWLHLCYASWFNARHRMVGPLFAGRFGSTPIENGAWACTVSLYVHLNPICSSTFGRGEARRSAERQGLLAPSTEVATRRVAALRAYRWSSYRAYAGYQTSPPWLDVATLLPGRSGVSRERQSAYRREAQGLLTQGVEVS